MKFKILDVKTQSGNIQVAVKHDECEREVFGLPLEFAEGEKWLDEVKRILTEREAKKVKLRTTAMTNTKEYIGKEFEI
jgi:hypothetical protein